ncbi:unnamed protein product [Rotaria sordida]|uniref:Uncharacterized protein n=1 Tax=Rotaria sordida TaxID=392033 RepID=A0A819VIR8_9BILA|nr:unnamed protein product [Rotaria sordida]
MLVRQDQNHTQSSTPLEIEQSIPASISSTKLHIIKVSRLRRHRSLSSQMYPTTLLNDHHRYQSEKFSITQNSARQLMNSTFLTNTSKDFSQHHVLSDSSRKRWKSEGSNRSLTAATININEQRKYNDGKIIKGKRYRSRIFPLL